MAKLEIERLPSRVYTEQINIKVTPEMKREFVRRKLDYGYDMNQALRGLVQELLERTKRAS